MEGIIDKDGWVDVRGFRINVTDESYFGGTDLPVMHFDQKHWRECGAVYPEISALHCEQSIGEFCMPVGGRFVSERKPNGAILVRVYAKEMPGSPVLRCTFPNPDLVSGEKIYANAMRGI